MSSLSSQRRVNELVERSSELILELELNDFTTARGPSAVDQRFKDFLRKHLYSPNGAETLEEFSQSLAVFGRGRPPEELSKVLCICADIPGDGPVVSAPKTPTEMGVSKASSVRTSASGKAACTLGAIQIFPTELSWGTRDSTDLNVFFNLVSNIELGRLVPYFTMNVVTTQEPVTTRGKNKTYATGLSLYSFLSPNDELNSTGALLATAKPLDISVESAQAQRNSREGKPTTVSGMELFTSPQTLVNGDEKFFDAPAPFESESESKLSRAVIDPFRPFMTLTDFSVDLSPAYAMEGYKTAKMSLVLHDRSRLWQITPIVQPNLYSSTEFIAEYGWSNGAPDTGQAQEQPIAEFMNGMRAKEKYRIINSSFTFDSVGQVKIDVELAMKGSVELATEVITSGEGSADLRRRIDELTAVIHTLSRKLSRSTLSDVSGFTALKAGSSTSSALRISQEAADEVTKFISATQKDGNDDLRRAGQLLQRLYGNGGRGGLVEEFKRTAKQEFDAKINSLTNNQNDAFAAPVPQVGVKASKPSKAPNVSAAGEGRSKKGYASLGKILMMFVGKPLQASGYFDEVQFLFYSCNPKASWVRYNNIAQLPIKISELRERFEDVFSPNYDVSIERFLTFLNDEFVQRDYGLEAYGLRSLYEFVSPDEEDIEREKAQSAGVAISTGITQKQAGETAVDPEEPKPSPKEFVLREAFRENKVLLRNKREELIANAYPEDHPVEYRRPQLRLVFQTLPGKTEEEDSTQRETDNNKSILRIVAYDEATGSFDALGEMYNALSPKSFNIFSINSDASAVKTDSTYGTQGVHSQHNDMRSHLVQATIDAGVLSGPQKVIVEGGTDTNGKPIKNERQARTIKASPARFKEFIKRISGCAHCTIGANGNIVEAANLTSMNDSAQASIRIVEASSTNKGAIAGDVDAGLPTFVQPTVLTVDMPGMPKLEYGTFVFFDFNTNTTIDNFYVCTGISHSIGPGKFKTSAEFTQVDSFEKFRSINTEVKSLIEQVGSLEGETQSGGKKFKTENPG